MRIRLNSVFKPFYSSSFSVTISQAKKQGLRIYKNEKTFLKHIFSKISPRIFSLLNFRF